LTFDPIRYIYNFDITKQDLKHTCLDVIPTTTAATAAITARASAVIRSASTATMAAARIGRGGRMGRFFDHGDLRLVVLKLIADKPSHGYELIKAVETAAGGAYTPSPGVIYPTLTLLEELGYVTAADAGGGKKLYTITAEGQAFLASNSQPVHGLFDPHGRSRRPASAAFSPQIMRARENLKTALRLKLTSGSLTPNRSRRSPRSWTTPPRPSKPSRGGERHAEPCSTATDRAARYMIQLAKHWSHKFEVTYDETSALIPLPLGTCRMLADPEGLDITVEAADLEGLARLEDVVAEHLLRFAFREPASAWLDPRLAGGPHRSAALRMRVSP
jgi:DNA-binding PadR family transcriptional regulator